MGDLFSALTQRAILISQAFDLRSLMSAHFTADRPHPAFTKRPGANLNAAKSDSFLCHIDFFLMH